MWEDAEHVVGGLRGLARSSFAVLNLTFKLQGVFVGGLAPVDSV